MSYGGSDGSEGGSGGDGDADVKQIYRDDIFWLSLRVQ